MIKIARPAKVEEKAIISYIVNGIGATMDSKLFLLSALTINDLKQKLKTYESVARKESTKIQPNEHNQDVCFNCGSNEHKRSFCPQLKEGPRCFKCNLFGHKSSECPGVRATAKKSINIAQKTEDDDKSEDDEDDDDDNEMWNLTKDEIGKIDRNFKNFVYGYRP